MKQIRRVDLIWQGEDVEQYEKMKNEAFDFHKEISEFIKQIIEKEINK